MRRRSISFALSLALASVACGGSSDSGTTAPTNTNTQTPTNGTFTMQINGATWNAVGTVGVSRGTNNFLGITGTGFTSITTGYSLIIGLGSVGGPGTFSVAFGNPAGSSMIVGGSNSNGWGTAFSGGTGSVTITTLTANHVVGTFTADATPGLPGTTGTLQLRNGRFDLTF